jgi:hypothetical protein
MCIALSECQKKEAQNFSRNLHSGLLQDQWIESPIGALHEDLICSKKARQNKDP